MPGGYGIDSHALLETVSEIVIAIDETGTVRYANSALEAALGCTAEEVVGQPVWQLIHPEDSAPLRQVLERPAAGDGDLASSLEFRGRHGDGSWRTFEARLSHFESSAGAPAIAIAARDITEQRRLEDHLRQAQKMEAVGLLASGIAHDFNNLLTGIRGYADLLLRDPTLSEPHRHDVHEIGKAAYRAAGLTRQLLAFSRRQDLKPQVIDPSAIIADLEKMLQRLIHENIEIRTSIPQKRGWIAADRSQFEQVVINLAVNARDAMPNGGVLQIDVDELELSETTARHHPPLQPGNYVCISVSDTGAGMDEETRQQIFEPFFTTKEPGKGTGLGLSTVQAIARKSGGIVSVSSAPGSGSHFQVILPRVQQAETGNPPAEQRASERDGRGTETVLLVEDETVVRNLARRVLAAKGYRVLTASDGAEAKQIAEQYQGEIHLLVSDVVMPNLGGGELARYLLQVRPTLRVLLVSGHAADSIGLEITDTRITFLAKPFTADSLTAKARQILDAYRG
jgi:PAS domain S-box-containing protein